MKKILNTLNFVNKWTFVQYCEKLKETKKNRAILLTGRGLKYLESIKIDSQLTNNYNMLLTCKNREK